MAQVYHSILYSTPDSGGKLKERKGYIMKVFGKKYMTITASSEGPQNAMIMLSETAFITPDYKNSVWVLDANNHFGHGNNVFIESNPGNGMRTIWKGDTPRILFNLTGFGQFQGVKDNPTTHLIKDLRQKDEYIKKNDNIPLNVDIESMRVLEVSVEGSLEELQEIRGLDENKDDDQDIVCYLHFGVYEGLQKLSMESLAVNNVTFNGMDERGKTAKDEKIVETDDLNHEYHCKLPVGELQNILNKQYNDKVMKFDGVTIGRFVCNSIYYNSLNLTKNHANEYCMFIHVPKFDQIDKDTQCNYAVSLIIEIANWFNTKK